MQLPLLVIDSNSGDRVSTIICVWGVVEGSVFGFPSSHTYIPHADMAPYLGVTIL